MGRCQIRQPVSALVVIGLGVLAAPAIAAQQRTCPFDLAIFASGGTDAVCQNMTIAARNGRAHVRVQNSGEWSARHQKVGNGADQIRFDTRAAREVVTISPDGKALWDINDRAENELYIMACADLCCAWKSQ